MLFTNAMGYVFYESPARWRVGEIVALILFQGWLSFGMERSIYPDLL